MTKPRKKTHKELIAEISEYSGVKRTYCKISYG